MNVRKRVEKKEKKRQRNIADDIAGRAAHALDNTVGTKN